MCIRDRPISVHITIGQVRFWSPDVLTAIQITTTEIQLCFTEKSRFGQCYENCVEKCYLCGWPSATGESFFTKEGTHFCKVIFVLFHYQILGHCHFPASTEEKCLYLFTLWGGLFSGRGFVRDTSIPVSYTHLDVYKRQSLVQAVGVCTRVILKICL